MSERLMRLATAGGAAMILACALPAVAGATDYCVEPVTSCAAGNNYQHLEDALAKADDAPDADRVLLGAVKYTALSVDGFVYQAPGSPVEIVGAGAGQTILTGPVGANGVLELSGGAGTSVSDLTVEGPQDASFGFWGVSTDGLAKRIQVVEDPNQAHGFRAGVYLHDDGRLEDSTVKLGLGASGVFLAGGHVDRSALTAEIGAKTNNGSIEHSRVAGDYMGVEAYGGSTSIAASVIYGGEDWGIAAESYAGVPQTLLTADSVTIIGSPGAGAIGALATTGLDTSWSAGVSLTNSVIRGFKTALGASAPGSGLAQVTASYSDYDPSGNSTAGGANASISEANVSNVGDAGFVDATGGDYHLLPGSPLMDAGDPGRAPGLDLDGNPLVADGNGDGSARRDIGAFEYPAPAAAGAPAAPAAPDTKAPVITDFRATPSLFAIARGSTPLAARTPRGTRFRYTLSEEARVTLRIQRRLAGRHARYRTVGVLSRSASSGANRTRFTGRLRKRALRPGRYRVRIVAIDAAGNRSAPRTTRFRVAS